MRVIMFYHSLLSDWNHGNAHFLRGIVSELEDRGHDVHVYEPADGWSLGNLTRDHGDAPLKRLQQHYSGLHSHFYDDAASLDLDTVLNNADLVIVHEWSPHELVARLNKHRARHGGYRLLFHDTHHRCVSEPESMAAYELDAYDGVLAFGEVIRERYLKAGWAARAWTWHEAADTRLFRPQPQTPKEKSLVWIGNWGDDERSEELHEFLLRPVMRLGLPTNVHGVRYPRHALDALASAGIDYHGWLANFEVPDTFARHSCTLHVPRRPYTQTLPGIPTIRVFEALACGIPLISAPWQDSEGLFNSGSDYLVARNGAEMEQQLLAILNEPALAAELSARGLETIQRRHTCAHRVDELLAIHAELQAPQAREQTA